MQDARDLPCPWIETPLVESAKLSKLAGCRVLLKLENLQPSGSFKSRGIGNLVRTSILAHPTGTPLHFYSSSGGNAGLACVTAASMLGYASAVVVPNSTKPAMIEKLRVAGASAVVQHGATWSEADAHLREDVIARDAGGVYVPPFDHPAVWAGAATMVPELEAQVGPAGALAGVVCSVGGGGLLCGIVQGLDASRFAGARVLAVETAGAASLHAAVQAGELVTLPGITSIATSLGATRVAKRAFEYGMRADVHCIVVSDAEAVDACWRFADEERMLVEPACGAALAVVYSGKLKDAMPELRPEDRLVIVVCGGVNVSVEALVEYRRMFGAAP